MAKTKSEMAAMKLDMTHLIWKIDNIQSDMAHLNTNVMTQLKSFIETISAQISVLNANMDSRLDKFENCFLFRMLFPVRGLCVFYCFLIIMRVFNMAVLGVRGTVATSYLRSQTPAFQTPAFQTPAFQTPAFQTRAVQTRA